VVKEECVIELDRVISDRIKMFQDECVVEEEDVRDRVTEVICEAVERGIKKIAALINTAKEDVRRDIAAMVYKARIDWSQVLDEKVPAISNTSREHLRRDVAALVKTPKDDSGQNVVKKSAATITSAKTVVAPDREGLARDEGWLEWRIEVLERQKKKSLRLPSRRWRVLSEARGLGVRRCCVRNLALDGITIL
jgi:hypothetical protein